MPEPASLIVVSDSTPISELAKVGCLWLLRALFGKVLIPMEVYGELTAGSHPAIASVVSSDWITVHPIGNQQEVQDLHDRTSLGSGECAAIVLAEEQDSIYILMDDRLGRREATSRGLEVLGSIGILLQAKEKGLLLSVRQVLDDLRKNGTWLGDSLYREALLAAGE
jgi:uncharacterized protein